jgi:AraC-like DNA-binding protein
MGGPRVKKPLDFTFRLVPLVLSMMKAKGLDGHPAARECALPEGYDTANEITAPLPKVRAFVDACALALGDDNFGLSMSNAVPKGTYALVEFIGRSAPTIREALQSLAAFGRIINTGIEWSFTQGENSGVCEHRVPGESDGLGRILNEYSLAFVFRACTEITGDRPKLTRLYFAHAAPKDLSALEAAFGVKPTFGNGVNGFELDNAVLSLPLTSADPALRRYLEEQGKAVLAQHPASADLIGQVRAELVKRLGKSDAKVESIAEVLSLAPRTLQRRLMDESTSFQNVLDDVREQLSMGYLQNESLTVSEIAYLLGYSELRAFDRAFRRWTGKTPVAWRVERRSKGS